MNKMSCLALLCLLTSTVQSYSAWTDTTIISNTQLDTDSQFVVVTANGTGSDTLQVEINGGSIGTLFANGNTEITMLAGTISNDFYGFDPENLDGDGIRRYPYLYNVNLNDTSRLFMSGGHIDGYINIAWSAGMEVYGYDFQYVPRKSGSGHLQGFWQDGQEFDLDFVMNSFDRVVLHTVPEPTAILLLGLGGLIFRRSFRAI